MIRRQIGASEGPIGVGRTVIKLSCRPLFFPKGGMPMEEVRNLNNKRVCDISFDRKVIEIVQKNCLTRITANPDGTLRIENVPITHAA